MKPPRPVVFLGAIAATVLVLVLCGALLIPRLVDSRLIRDKISAELLSKSHGRVTFGKINFLWFPRPRVVIENAELTFAGKTQSSIRIATIYPSIFYLLTGRLVVRRALLQEPKLRMRLPESSAKSSDLEGLEKQLRSALVQFASALPTPRIEVADGSAEIRLADKPRLILEKIAAQTVFSPGELRIGLRARANLCEQFKVDGKIVPETLAAEINIGVSNLQVKELLVILAPEHSSYAQEGTASLNAQITSVGLRQFQAEISGAIGPLVIARHGGTAAVEAKNFRAGIQYQSGAFQVDVQRLDLESPRMRVAGQLTAQPGRWSARIQVRDANIAQLQDLARRIADDHDAVRIARRYVSAGTIPEMSIQSAGASIAELMSRKNLAVSGSLHGGTISIPGPDLELKNVTGSVQFSEGILAADGVSANLGTTKGWNGNLRLGLDGKTAPFHLDISFQASAPEAHAVLLKLVRDDALREQLLKVKNVEGGLSGRLILGERLEAIAPILTLAKADISVHYAPIPFPVAVSGGRFSYDRNVIRVDGAQASMGRSRFGKLGMTFHRDGSRRMVIGAQQVSLDVRQLDTLHRSFKELRGYFTKLQSARGQVELHKLTLTGAYDEPAGWVVESTGSVSQVEMQHADLPDRIVLRRGKFATRDGQIVFTDTDVSMSDAAFIANGRYEFNRGRSRQFEASGRGSIGARMTQWFSHAIALPEDMQFRAPLTIDAERVAWRAGGDFSFAGQLITAAGPKLILDVVQQPQGFTMPNLRIQDGDRSARITAQRARDKFEMSFNGELTEQTFDKIFASLPTQPISLKGDVQVSALMTDPMTVSVRGQLSGSHISIPLGPDKLLVDSVRLDAVGDSVVIRSADIRWGQSRFTASGTVAGAKEPMRLDLDVAVDQFDWQQYQRVFGAEAGQRQDNKTGVMPIPAVTGTIRLKAGRATFERFNLSALAATATIAPSGISADIVQGSACGISASGSIKFIGKEIGVDLQLTASEAPLEPVALCLTDQQDDVKGTYSMRARLAGRGEPGQMWQSLKGNFEFDARDGEFIRSPGIDATFDYLNASGDFKLAFPDLDRDTFPYRLIGVKGRIAGKLLIADEVNVASAQVNLSGQGEIDMESKRIDGKALVAVLKPVDDVLARIPLISSMLGGSLVGIPVRVAGPIERPEVTYLSPADVGAQLLDMPLRILGIPFGAMRLFTPGGDLRDKDLSK